jgi:hypothetical protein
MTMHTSPTSRKTSLDTLRHEDLLLKGLFERIGESRGSSVDTRYDYGNAAKQISRHIAIRQSSLMNVATAIAQVPALSSTGRRMIDRATDRRVLIDKVGGMSRNIQGIYLNQGQDFDGPLTALIDAVSPELEWELSDALPLVQRTLSTEDAAALFSSARYVERHAPTSLNTSGPRWYERAPVISRLVTFFDFVRDHPRASRNERIA